MTTLTGPERPAASGAADSLVVFLHGYGADGNDLIGLAEPLAPHLPNTRFVAPNAPERCLNNPFGLPVVSDPLARRLARGGRASRRRGGVRGCSTPGSTALAPRRRRRSAPCSSASARAR